MNCSRYLIALSLLFTFQADASKRLHIDVEDIPAIEVSTDPVAVLNLIDRGEKLLWDGFRTEVCYEMSGSLGVLDDPWSVYTYQTNMEMITSSADALHRFREAFDKVFDFYRKNQHYQSTGQEELERDVAALKALLDNPYIEREITISSISFPQEWSYIWPALDMSTARNENGLRLMGENCICKLQACYRLQKAIASGNFTNNMLRHKQELKKLPERLTQLMDLYIAELSSIIKLFNISKAMPTRYDISINGCYLTYSLPSAAPSTSLAKTLLSLHSTYKSIAELMEGTFSGTQKIWLWDNMQPGSDLFRRAVDEGHQAIYTAHFREKLRGYSIQDNTFKPERCPELKEYSEKYPSFNDLEVAMTSFAIDPSKWTYGKLPDPTVVAVTYLTWIFEACEKQRPNLF